MGFLKESQPHGHGELKKGRISSQAASIYTGEWNAGNKHGYGVLDEITKGLHKLWYTVYTLFLNNMLKDKCKV